MKTELDYEHVLEIMREPIINPRCTAKYLYFNENSYYSCTGAAHFMNLAFAKDVSYYIVFWSDSTQRASITKTYESDTFDDDTREVFKLFDMYFDEEQHFMDSTVKDVPVPFSVMQELRKLCTVLQENYIEYVHE